MERSEKRERGRKNPGPGLTGEEHIRGGKQRPVNPPHSDQRFSEFFFLTGTEREKSASKVQRALPGPSAHCLLQLHYRPDINSKSHCRTAHSVTRICFTTSLLLPCFHCSALLLTRGYSNVSKATPNPLSDHFCCYGRWTVSIQVSSQCSSHGYGH